MKEKMPPHYEKGTDNPTFTDDDLGSKGITITKL